MGAGIAQACAQSKIQVFLTDGSREIVDGRPAVDGMSIIRMEAGQMEIVRRNRWNRNWLIMK